MQSVFAVNKLACTVFVASVQVIYALCSRLLYASLLVQRIRHSQVLFRSVILALSIELVAHCSEHVL